MAGHAGLVHADGVDELGHRTLAATHGVEDPTASRFGDHLEDGELRGHRRIIRCPTYMFQQMYCDVDERGRRQDRLQRTEATFDPLPFGADAARAYGRIFACVMAAGSKARGARAVDLLIAATALASELPLYTRNGDDFRALDGLVEIVVV